MKEKINMIKNYGSPERKEKFFFFIYFNSLGEKNYEHNFKDNANNRYDMVELEKGLLYT